MGVNLVSGEGNSYSAVRSRRRRAPMNEINMTPFIDVMLVLLIIFMVSAPMMTSGVPVDLPKVGASSLKDPDQPIEIRVLKNRLLIQDSDVTLPQLNGKLQALGKEKKDTPVHLRADRTLPYEEVMQVISTVRQAGFTKLSLIADAPSQK